MYDVQRVFMYAVHGYACMISDGYVCMISDWYACMISDGYACTMSDGYVCMMSDGLPQAWTASHLHVLHAFTVRSCALAHLHTHGTPPMWPQCALGPGCIAPGRSMVGTFVNTAALLWFWLYLLFEIYWNWQLACEAYLPTDPATASYWAWFFAGVCACTQAHALHSDW